mgnify:FL=1
MADTGEKKSRTRAFGSAFMLTLCLLLLGCGFFIADVNTRQVTFGNTEPRLEYAVENGVLRLKAIDGQTLELPPAVQEWAGLAWNLLPARWRAATCVTQLEQELIPGLLDTLESPENEDAAPTE